MVSVHVRQVKLSSTIVALSTLALVKKFFLLFAGGFPHGLIKKGVQSHLVTSLGVVVALNLVVTGGRAVYVGDPGVGWHCGAFLLHKLESSFKGDRPYYGHIQS